jgi:HPt (histidine-containing phosphotransfer) domain-containing protein
VNELRAYFVEGSRARLTELRAAFDRLPDAEAMQIVARHFHAFAGMGGTYGFTRVSELGDAAEETTIPLFRSGAQPDPATVARWRELADEIERELC